MKTQIVKKLRGFTLVEIMIVVAIIGLLASMAVPSFLQARRGAQRTACINNLRNIDGAKERWALDNRKGLGDAVVNTEVDVFLKGGAPKCPGGGIYEYKAVDVSPECSLKTIAGHTL